MKVTDLILNMIDKAARQDAAFLVDLAALQVRICTAGVRTMIRVQWVGRGVCWIRWDILAVLQVMTCTAGVRAMRCVQWAGSGVLACWMRAAPQLICVFAEDGRAQGNDACAVGGQGSVLEPMGRCKCVGSSRQQTGCAGSRRGEQAGWRHMCVVCAGGGAATLVGSSAVGVVLTCRQGCSADVGTAASEQGAAGRPMTVSMYVCHCPHLLDPPPQTHRRST